jgi:hypothetical protein
MRSVLARELRENCGNLRDAGWESTARLMEVAADELERLGARVCELEQRLLVQPPPGELDYASWRKRLVEGRALLPTKPH